MRAWEWKEILPAVTVWTTEHRPSQASGFYLARLFDQPEHLFFPYRPNSGNGGSKYTLETSDVLIKWRIRKVGSQHNTNNFSRILLMYSETREGRGGSSNVKRGPGPFLAHWLCVTQACKNLRRYKQPWIDSQASTPKQNQSSLWLASQTWISLSSKKT